MQNLNHQKCKLLSRALMSHSWQQLEDLLVTSRTTGDNPKTARSSQFLAMDNRRMLPMRLTFLRQNSVFCWRLCWENWNSDLEKLQHFNYERGVFMCRILRQKYFRVENLHFSKMYVLFARGGCICSKQQVKKWVNTDLEGVINTNKNSLSRGSCKVNFLKILAQSSYLPAKFVL